MLLLQTSHHHPHPQQHHPGHPHQPHQQQGHQQPPLVLSLSQIQSGGGLLIVNPHGNDQQMTPLPPGSGSGDNHLLHSSNNSNRSDTSNSSALDGTATSPVSSAVRSIIQPLLVQQFSIDDFLYLGEIPQQLVRLQPGREQRQL